MTKIKMLSDLNVVVEVVQRGMYQHKVDLDMLNAVKFKLADVSSVSPSSEQRWADEGLKLVFTCTCLFVYCPM